jgi:predicted nuclease of predicted toxin-antitoxin system
VRWIADECVSARLVKLLREAGHDVAYAAEMAAGASDRELIDHARRENRLLLTDGTSAISSSGGAGPFRA